MKLYENGVYLVNGSELIEDAPSAAEEDLKQNRKKHYKRRSSKKYDRLWNFRSA